MEIQLKSGETLDELAENLWLLQRKDGYRFSLDSVLLAGFMKSQPGDRIFDLGTGSGIIPLLLLRREPQLKIMGLELQQRLAEQAKRNVEINGLSTKISIVQGDVRALQEEWLGNWDVITANPPFFTSNSGRVNPLAEKAIARHELNGNLADFIEAGAKLLKNGGRLVLIQQGERLAEVLNLFNKNNFHLSQLAIVYPKKNSQGKLVLVEGVLGRKVSTKIHPGIILHEPGGEYTAQLERLFAGGNLFD